MSTSNLLERFPAPDGSPKYAKLRDSLVAAIGAGHWKPGDRFPTEVELAKNTPFSLGTVQRALRDLVARGVISRVQGSGTFVSSATRKIEDTWHCRFLNDDESGYLPVFSRPVSRALVRKLGPWTRHFPGVNLLARIDRILSVNGEFNVYSRFYFDAGRFKALATRPLSQLSGTNFKDLLRDEFKVPVTDINQRVVFGRLPKDVARLIQVATNTNGGLLEAVGKSASGETLYYQEFFIPPSPRKFVPTSSRSA